MIHKYGIGQSDWSLRNVDINSDIVGGRCDINKTMIIIRNVVVIYSAIILIYEQRITKHKSKEQHTKLSNKTIRYLILYANTTQPLYSTSFYNDSVNLYKINFQ